MTKSRPLIILGVVLLLLFAVFTWAVQNIAVAPIGPEGSEVGFSGINAAVRDKIGSNLTWYEITDLLGYGVLLIAAGFMVFALMQVLHRRTLRIDGDLIALAIFYVVVGITYIFFEQYIVNYRPIILEEGLEASYPSSHTLLSLCIMGSALMQFDMRLIRGRVPATVLCSLVMVVIVVGRLLSGVHWFTDIAASVLLSAGLLSLYGAALRKFV